MNSFKKCIGNLRSKRLLGIGILILLIIPLSILMDSARWGPSEASGGYITPTLENSSQETFAGPNYFFELASPHPVTSSDNFLLAIASYRTIHGEANILNFSTVVETSPAFFESIDLTLACKTHSNGQAIEMWYLKNPNPGINNLNEVVIEMPSVWDEVLEDYIDLEISDFVLSVQTFSGVDIDSTPISYGCLNDGGLPANSAQTQLSNFHEDDIVIGAVSVFDSSQSEVISEGLGTSNIWNVRVGDNLTSRGSKYSASNLDWSFSADLSYVLAGIVIRGEEDISGGGDTYPEASLIGSNFPAELATDTDFSITVNSGENRLLLVFANYNDGFPWGEVDNQIVDITFNSSPLTKACKGSIGDMGSEVWYLSNPSVGSNNIAITYQNENMLQAMYHIVQVNGAHQVNPIIGSDCDGVNASVINMTPLTEDYSLIVGSSTLVVGTGIESITSGTNLWSNAEVGWIVSSGGYRQSMESSSNSIEWQTTGSPVVNIAGSSVAIRKSSGEEPPPPTGPCYDINPEQQEGVDFQYLCKWGEFGSSEGQLEWPQGIATTPDSKILVSDHANRVQKFTKYGVYESYFGSSGSGNGQFSSVYDLAVASNGDIFTADSGNERVQKFNSSGTFISSWNGEAVSSGYQFKSSVLAYDGAGVEGNKLYVANEYDKKIIKFDTSGNYILDFGGAGEGLFQDVTAIAVSPITGFVYVLDRLEGVIHKYDREGNEIRRWGSYGTGNDQFDNTAWGLSITKKDVLYVYSHSRIQLFDRYGNFLTKIENTDLPVESGGFVAVRGGTFVDENKIYIFDSNTSEIKVLRVDNSLYKDVTDPEDPGDIDSFPKPTITFSLTPPLSTGGILTFEGTAEDGNFNISGLEITCDQEIREQIIPLDGSFNSLSENFRIRIATNNPGIHSLSIKAITSAGSRSQPYNFEIDSDPRIPTFTLNNQGTLPIHDTTPNYQGVATAKALGATITNVEFSIFDAFEGWEVATPIDGNFNSVTEEFSFTSPVLSDGSYLVSVRVTDSLGNITSDDQLLLPGAGLVADRVVVDTVDTDAPEILLYQIIPNPTIDKTPKLQGKVKDKMTRTSSNITSIMYQVAFEGDPWAPWKEVPVLEHNGVLGLSKEYTFNFELDELEIGEYLVTVQASDDSLDSPDAFETIEFEVIERPPGIQSVKLTKSQNFTNYDDFDFIGSNNIIWGNGKLRLKEKFNPVITTLSNTDVGDRYFRDYSSIHVYKSQANGVWMTKSGTKFSFYSFANSTEYQFDLVDLNPGFAGSETSDIIEVFVGGNYHVLLANGFSIITLNFGSSIINGIDSYTSFNTGYNVISSLSLDDRNLSNYGVYFACGTSTLCYYRPGVIENPGDDVFVEISEGVHGIPTTSIVSTYLDKANNYLWIGSYNQGVSVIDDKGVPTNPLGFTFGTYGSLTQVFAITKDKNNKMFFAGDRGLEMIYSDGGDIFNPLNSQIENIVTIGELGIEVASSLAYLPGDSIIGSQFFIGTRSGEIFYLSINDTYLEKRDDQFIRLDLSENQYPVTVQSFYLLNNNTIIAGLHRKGILRVNLNRGFESVGVAMTKVDAQIEGRLDVDFITLNSVNITNLQGGVTYHVSNNGGLTWLPIVIGQTVKFPQTDYRIVFRVTLTSGSTPVISSFNLSYSAYLDFLDRTLYDLLLDEEPEVVTVNTPFGFRIDVLDQLLNLYYNPTTVEVELRRLSDNAVVPDFNINQVTVNNGSTYIPNAQSSVLGTYYIYAKAQDGVESYSNPITFISTPVIPPPTPSSSIQLNFSANSYKIKPGEKVTLTWVTNNATSVSISPNIGFVALSGSYEVSPTETTTYVITASNGITQITSSLTVTVEDDTEVDVNLVVDGLLPEINLINTPEIIEIEKGEKVRIEWEVNNAETVFIDYLNNEVSSAGHFEFFPDSDTLINIIASNQFGEASKKIQIIVNLPFESSSLLHIGPFAGAAFVTFATLVSLLTPLIGNTGPSIVGVLIGTIFPRKRKYWGIVYNQNSFEPIPLCAIRLYGITSDQKIFVGQTVSDLRGKYGFVFDKTEHSSYLLEARAQGFEKFEKTLSKSSLMDENEIIMNISMKEEGQDVNYFLQILRYSKQNLVKYLQFFIFFMMFLGVAYSLYVAIKAPRILNFAILLGYALIFLINLLIILRTRLRNAGKIIDSNTKKGIGGVSLTFYDSDNNIVDLAITNNEGIIKVNLETGEYSVIVGKSGYELTDGNRLKSKITVLEGGYIKGSIRLSKISGVDSPFSVASKFEASPLL